MPSSRVSTIASGKTWLEGTGNPDPNNGTMNNYYLDKSVGNVFLKTAPTTWTLVGNMSPAEISGKWSSGSGAPDENIGTVGDFYLDIDSGLVYEKTDETTWTFRADLTPPGATGVWTSGSGAPASGLGNVGDFYLDLTASQVYEKTDETTWTQRQISATVAGGIWHVGTAAPSSSLGSIGDFYLNTANGDVYEKTDGTTWTVRGDLSPTIVGIWHSGSGAPDSELGNVSDFYLDTSSGEILEKIGVNAWTTRGDITNSSGGSVGDFPNADHIVDTNISIATAENIKDAYGYQIPVGNKILLTKQSNDSENGLYIVNSYSSYTINFISNINTLLNSYVFSAATISNGLLEIESFFSPINTIDTGYHSDFIFQGPESGTVYYSDNCLIIEGRVASGTEYVWLALIFNNPVDIYNINLSDRSTWDSMNDIWTVSNNSIERSPVSLSPMYNTTIITPTSITRAPGANSSSDFLEHKKCLAQGVVFRYEGISNPTLGASQILFKEFSLLHEYIATKDTYLGDIINKKIILNSGNDIFIDNILDSDIHVYDSKITIAGNIKNSKIYIYYSENVSVDALLLAFDNPSAANFENTDFSLLNASEYGVTVSFNCEVNFNKCRWINGIIGDNGFFNIYFNQIVSFNYCDIQSKKDSFVANLGIYFRYSSVNIKLFLPNNTLVYSLKSILSIPEYEAQKGGSLEAYESDINIFKHRIFNTNSFYFSVNTSKLFISNMTSYSTAAVYMYASNSYVEIEYLLVARALEWTPPSVGSTIFIKSLAPTSQSLSKIPAGSFNILFANNRITYDRPPFYRTSTDGYTISSLNKEYAPFRNKIVNGAMRFFSRKSGSAIIPVDGEFHADKWYYKMTSSSLFSSEQSTDVPTYNLSGVDTLFSNSLKITSQGIYSPTGLDTFAIVQAIEGTLLADCARGVDKIGSGIGGLVLSFWVKCSKTGTYGGSLFNPLANRSFPFSFSVTSTWKFVSIYIPNDSDTYDLTRDTNTGYRLFIALGVGSNYVASSGSWTTGEYRSGAATHIFTATNITFNVTGVQLEIARLPPTTYASPYELLPYTIERELCDRYCVVYGGSSVNEIMPFLCVNNGSGGQAAYLSNHRFRSDASISLSNANDFAIFDGNTSIALSSWSSILNSSTMPAISMNFSSASVAGKQIWLKANNTINARCIISSENL